MANPTLNERALRSSLELSAEEHSMSVNGTILKTCFLGLLMMITFGYNWALILSGFADKAIALSKLGLVGGIVLVLIICFAPKNKFLMITTPLYALCEGLILGYISALANTYYPGVASQAAIGTFLALFGMFILYKSNIVKCTDKFRMVLFNSTFAIFGLYLIQIILNFFNISIPFIFSNSPVGIAFSVIVVAIASFNLIVDFHLIEHLSDKMPKYMEWYCGFSLLVTLVWMYLEILNLLMKIQSRD